MTVYVKTESIVDIDPGTGKPRVYLKGEYFPRRIEKLIQLGHLEEREEEKKTKNKREA